MDLISTGQSSLSRKAEIDQLEGLRAAISSSARSKMAFSKLLKQFNENSDVSITMSQLRNLCDKLEQESFIRIEGDHVKRFG